MMRCAVFRVRLSLSLSVLLSFLLRWSEYGNGQNQQGGEGSGCGGDGGDEFWYLGRTQCFRANVAYSLYGIKTGKSAANPCGSGNYINSFFTTGGIESFGNNVGVDYANYGVSTTCTATYTGNGNNNNNKNQNNNNNNNQLYYPDYTSTTLGCSASGEFITATFQGAYCDGNHFLSNDGAVTNLNSDLESLGCLKIYDSSNAGAAQDNGNGNGDDGYNDYGVPALNLLSYSSSCSHTEYPTRCPDPHGVKRARDKKLFRYAQAHYRAVPLIMPIMSTILLIGAAMLYCLANGIRDGAKRRAIESATGEALDPTIYEQFSASFNHVATDISQRTRTFSEKLAEYAEEEDDDIGPENTYEAPGAEDDPVHSAVAKDAAQAQVANAMLAEKGITPKAAAAQGGGKPTKNYKRPRLAKISKWVRGRVGRSKDVPNL